MRFPPWRCCRSRPRRVVDSKVANDDTIMSAFYRADGLHRVRKKFQGKSMLTAEEVEDVVAYLMTLKDEK